MAEEVLWTKEQQQVISLRDRSLLVSAAAGSGKTAVLVQRIIERICDSVHPVDIDRLLVVTFTNAAAGEMRERVQSAISARLEQQPDNAHLKRQEVLAGHAHITTIDSFCLSVLREHFQEIHLDPGFRIADEGELKLLQADVLSRLLEEEYEQGSETFLNFMEAYAPGKDDERAADMILQLYEFAIANPRPEDWLDHCLDSYGVTSFEELEEQPWMKNMLEQLRTVLLEQASFYQRILELCREETGMEAYEAVLLAEQADIQKAGQTCGYQQLRQAVSGIRFGTKPRKRKTDLFSEEKARRAWEMRDQAKKQIKSLQEQYLADEPQRLLQKQSLAGTQVRELVRLTHSFLSRYSSAKRKKNLVDFADLEHLALDILSRKTPEGEVPTETADQYRACFEEIMIDEYQDSNAVQELILTSIARKDPPNLFMVGDVKQSIYRFRLARPELFMEKYASYTTEESEHQKIELHQNFRSRSTVLDAVNYFFYQLMQKSVGNVAYDDEAALHPGLSYAPCGEHRTGGAAELLLLDLEDVQEEEEENQTDGQEVFAEPSPDAAPEPSYSSREWEAALIAEEIRCITDPEKGLYVWDKERKAYRLCAYRDIAILLRTMSGWAEEFVPVLMAHGISAAADTGSGYFSALEVQTALNLLEIIDNPLQDIPLAAVLHSPIGHFTSQELAVVRAENTPARYRYLYDAVTAYASGHAGEELAVKLSAFLSRLEGYREKSRCLQLRELLDYVLKDSGYYEFVSAMPGASGRKANLDMLLTRAGAFEKTSYQGVFQFVRYINRLKKYSVDYALAQSETAGNQVRIMSIHKSKGLEFPVCFVAGLGKSFNRRDVNGAMLFSVDYGIGTEAIDPVRRTREGTVMKQAIRQQSILENLGEELRVLYVAMTRAKEKLYLVGAKSGMLEYLERRIRETDPSARELPYYTLTGAGCFLDWIVCAAAKHSGFKEIDQQLGIPVPFSGPCFQASCQLAVRMIVKSSLSMQAVTHRAEELLKRSALEEWKPHCTDPGAAALIRDRFRVSYRSSPLSGLPAAFSVSELTHSALSRSVSLPDEGEPVRALVEEEAADEVLPAFLQEKKPLSGASRGTLYHWLFEHFDFRRELGAQLAHYMEEKQISEEERKQIRLSDFKRFAMSALGQRVAAAMDQGRYHREMPFILGVTAQEMLSEAKNSQAAEEAYVSVQGVIDAWIEEEDGLILIDFKTDCRPDGMDEEGFAGLLRERYSSQLSYYKRALEQMTKKQVRKICLYAVALGREITVDYQNVK